MKRATSGTVQSKPPTLMQIPVREVKGVESLALGFRAAFFTLADGDDGVYGGAGLGSPWVEVRWKGRTFAIHTIELLAAIVGTYDPEEAKAITKATVGQGIGVTAESYGEDEG